MKIKKVLAGLDKEDLKQIKETGTFIIPEDITEIGDSAFFALRSLKRIVIPESVERIGEMAFAGCGTIEEITFKGKPTIAEYAFEDCDVNLIITTKKISKQDRVALVSEFTDAQGEFVYTYPEGNAFVELIRTGVYITPKGVEIFETGALQGAKELQKLVITEDVKKVESFAFADCPNLTEVVFEGVPEMQALIFTGSGIKKVVISGKINADDRDRLIKALKENFYYDEKDVKFIFDDESDAEDENVSE